MPKFKIEQIAISMPEHLDVRRGADVILNAIGLSAESFTKDIVVAQGKVFGAMETNVAELKFNYEVAEKVEFEILTYKAGNNWISKISPVVSHFGMHCSMGELSEWKAEFKKIGVEIAQEVDTISHTNEAIKDNRRYHYCIFDTRKYIGVDLKFIVRKDIVNGYII